MVDMWRRLDMGREDPNALHLVTDADGEEYSITAMYEAAGLGQLEAAALLLQRGAGPDRPSSDGATPLMAAASAGHKAMVRLLVKHGQGPVDAVDPATGWTGPFAAALISRSATFAESDSAVLRSPLSLPLRLPLQPSRLRGGARAGRLRCE